MSTFALSLGVGFLVMGLAFMGTIWLVLRMAKTPASPASASTKVSGPLVQIRNVFGHIPDWFKNLILVVIVLFLVFEFGVNYYTKLSMGREFGSNYEEVIKKRQKERFEREMSAENDPPDVSSRVENATRGAQIAQQPIERVIWDYYTIPANGTLDIQKKRRCAVGDLIPEHRKIAVLSDAGKTFRYTSTHSEPIKVKVWQYDEGGTCTEDYKKLLAEKAFL